MRYLSVCSGIEAATVAWHPLGWQAAGFSEIEKFPSQVLAHHYPDVPNLGDMTAYKEWNLGTIDLLVGGTPCQSFSVAGLRKGLDDPRGNLALVYCGILDHFRPKWFVWENVPGVLSSNGGRDFGSFLGAVAELGYGFAYRVLDAQWFGVAQRRRRVFVVGYLGDWRRAAAVLFERQSLRRDLAPSREAGQKVAPTVVQGPPYSRTGNERVECDAIVAQPFDVANCLTARMHKGINSTIDEGQTPVVQAKCFQQNTRDEVRYIGGDGQIAGALAAEAGMKQQNYVQVPIAIQGNLIGRGENAGPQGIGVSDSGAMYTLTKADVHGVAQPIPIQDQATRYAGKRGDKQDGKGNGLGIGKPGDPAPTLTKGDKHAVAQPIVMRESGQGYWMEDDKAGTLRAEGENRPSRPSHVVAQPIGWSEELNALEGVQPTLQRGGQGGRNEGIMQTNMAVRRLTPVECERLQGFPDNYTNIPWRNKPESPDGPRYKALGNSMAVPVMHWIGKRIATVDKL